MNSLSVTLPRISIVTPNYNAGRYLEQAIQSVLNQGYPNLEYIIVDGGSTDNSLEIIKKYEQRISCWLSQPDRGLYDALNKGFEMTSGDIMGWLNSDDMLHPRSLFSLARLFSSEIVEWVQGTHTWFDEHGCTFRTLNVPVMSRYCYLLKEYHKGRSPFIQQESTYWRRSLWTRAGGFVSTKYKLAGDFELWMRFFQHSNLYVTKCLIGGFRVRRNGQLSSKHYQEYLREADEIVDNYPLTDTDKKNLARIKKLNSYSFLRWPLLGRFLNRQRKKLYPRFGTVDLDPGSERLIIKQP